MGSPHFLDYLSTRILRAGRQVNLNKKRVAALTAAGVIVIGAIYGAWLRPPADFTGQRLITIEQGASFSAVAQQLNKEKIIRSPGALRVFVALFGGDDQVIAGDYYFDDPANVMSVAFRITDGEHGITPVRVRIPEGATVVEIADVLAGVSPSFGKEKFIARAADLEGYLFPDTYYFQPNIESDEVITALRATFQERIKPLREIIEVSPRDLNEIVTMASLLEKEASDYETRQRIAGVLWKRLEIGMPLQVDAVFPYILGRNTYEVTEADLDVESPYNTYRYTGLPPGPIANPGLESIRAAVFPIESEHLYYLADRSGNTYFSETFDEHVEKKRRYVN